MKMKKMKKKLISSLSVLIILVYSLTNAQEIKVCKKTIQLKIDSLISSHLDSKNMSGAVVLVKSKNKIIYEKAFGYAFKYGDEMEEIESPEMMTTDHLFDLASLTKVLATTFAIMILDDQGKLSLNDTVSKYLSEFKTYDKKKITIRQLLTHSSGLKEWYPLYYLASTKHASLKAISKIPVAYPPGEGRHYSDLGFMTLGYVVEKISGLTLDKFLCENLYNKLHLNSTVFNPKENLKTEKIAATSHGNPFEKKMVYDDNFGYKIEGIDPASWNKWRRYTLKGEVNDGNSWYANGGVAGHAGLFSTVDEIQILIDFLLNNGCFNGMQIISNKIIKKYLTKDNFQNGLGWMMDVSLFSAEGAPEHTFGHTGFTGTSIVVFPDSKTSIILLTNRQHVNDLSGNYYNLKGLRQNLLNIVLDCEK